MMQYDDILDETPDAPRRRPLVFRLTLWAAMALCATLIATVLLSDPFIARRVQDAADTLSMRLDGLRPDRPAVARSDEPPEGRPAVRSMPSDRIPVRRAGITGQE